MAQMTIRPSSKPLLGWAVLEGVALLAYLAFIGGGEKFWVFFAILLLVGVGTSISVLKQRSKVMHVSDGRLRYESGLASKTTRTLELEKIQDVRVDQSLTQRMLRLGSITIVTASETGSLTMEQIDRPQQTADEILNLARSGSRRF